MTTHTQITPGQTLENPVTGERFTFVHTAATTGGELLAFDFALRPGGAVPMPHVHPVQTERFEVVEGLMRFRVGLRTGIAGPGDVVEVAPGVMHSFANAGDERGAPAGRGPAGARDGGDVGRGRRDGRAGRMGRAAGMPRNLVRPSPRLARTLRAGRRHAPLLGVGGQRLLLAPFVLSARHPRAGLAVAAVATPGLGALG